MSLISLFVHLVKPLLQIFIETQDAYRTAGQLPSQKLVFLLKKLFGFFANLQKLI